MQPILVLAAVSVSALLCRNVSVTELYALLQGMQLMAARIRDDRVASFASVFIAGFVFCLVQQFYDIRSICEPTVILEDVYQKDIPVP